MKVNSNKGFSLVELLVGVGILGLLTIGTMKMVTQQQSNESYIRARAEISKTISLLRQTLNNPENCKYMLGGQSIGTSFTSAPSISQLRVAALARSKTATAQVTQTILESGRNYGSFFLNADAIKLVQGTSALNTPDLVIRFQIPAKSLLGFGSGSDSKMLEAKIPINPILNASNRIRACGVSASESIRSAKEVFCRTLMQQNIATWDGTNCHLKSLECKNGLIPRSLKNLGSLSPEFASDPARYGCVSPTQIYNADQFFAHGALRSDGTPAPTGTCVISGNGITLRKGADGRVTLQCL